MTYFYTLGLPLAPTLSQAQIIDLLKKSGSQCIQTGGGLCVRSSLGDHEIRDLLSQNGMTAGFTLAPLDADAARREEHLGKDVEAFLAG